MGLDDSEVIMSAWGYALFSDDTACDVRDHYRELIEDQVSDAEGVAHVDDDRHSAAPHLVLLDFHGDTLPNAREISQIPDGAYHSHRDEYEPHLLRAWETFRAIKRRKKDPDYAEAGFQLLDASIRRERDGQTRAQIYLAWSQLAEDLDRRA